MTTTITIEANATSDVELRFTKAGQPVCSLRIATSTGAAHPPPPRPDHQGARRGPPPPPRRKNPDGDYVDTATEYYDVTAWGTLAENTAESIAKGDRVLIHGSTYAEEWRDRNGDL